ncbi:MAG: NAD-dependent epimerase/dehydratase family protein [Acidobacteriota bacterium]
MADRLVLVTGATGAVGPSVVRACQAAGYSVRTLSMGTPAGDVLPSGVDVHVGDVCDEQTVRSTVAGAEVVVHLAALLHQYENLAGLGPQYERVNVGGTENVVRAAIAEGVRRVVFLSTIAVYGPSSGRLIDENTPPRPDTIYGRTKLAAEQAVLSATSGGQPIGTVLRAAAAYGSRVKGNYRRLAVAIARRRFVPLGPCLNRRTVVHDRDLANAAVLAARHPAAPGAVFNVSDGHVHTLADIINAIYRAVGRRPPRLYVPLAAARNATSVCENTCRMVGVRPPITKTLLKKYTEDIAVDGTLIQRALGFAPSVDLETGWQETMAALHDGRA